MSPGLSQAVTRIHAHIAEMREDGISEQAILAALGQAHAEVVRGICGADREALRDIAALTVQLITGEAT